jgi:hypothetical protein
VVRTPSTIHGTHTDTQTRDIDRARQLHVLAYAFAASEAGGSSPSKQTNRKRCPGAHGAWEHRTPHVRATGSGRARACCLSATSTHGHVQTQPNGQRQSWRATATTPWTTAGGRRQEHRDRRREQGTLAGLQLQPCVRARGTRVKKIERAHARGTAPRCLVPDSHMGAGRRPPAPQRARVPCGRLLAVATEMERALRASGPRPGKPCRGDGLLVPTAVVPVWSLIKAQSPPGTSDQVRFPLF